MPRSRHSPGEIDNRRLRSFNGSTARFLWATLSSLLVAGEPCLGQVETSAAPSSILAESALLRVVEQVSTPARTAGVLASMYVKEGDVVEEGALLAKVDDAEVKLTYDLAVIAHRLASHRAANDVAIRSSKKALDFSRKEFQRLSRASDELPGSISQSELEESQVIAEKASLDVEQARHANQLDTLNERLKRKEREVALHAKRIHQILAPINGVVVEILRRRGEWVEPGEDVLRIMRIDRLRAEGLVDVRHAMQELHGVPVEVTVSLPGRPDVKANGRVVFVSPEINPVSGRVRVRAEFDNPAGRLMPGMRAAMVIHPRSGKEPKPKVDSQRTDSAHP